MGEAVRQEAKEMGFWDHVEELRQRLIRCTLYVAVGSVAAWFFRTPLLKALEYPALEGARRAGVQDFSFRIFEAAGGLMLMVQVALVGGIVLASPLLTMELWGFLSPALHPHERRWVMWALPTATALFLLGVVTCYWIAPAAFAFFFRFNVTLGVRPELTLAPYLYFFMRLALVFGVLFELPLFLMILGAAGLISSAGLLRQWRAAVVGIFIVAAVATPTGDALTMTVLAAPMVVLYVLSVVLVRVVEKKRVAGEEIAGEAEGSTAASQAGAQTSLAEGTAGPAEEIDIDELYRQMREQQDLDR